MTAMPFLEDAMVLAAFPIAILRIRNGAAVTDLIGGMDRHSAGGDQIPNRVIEWIKRFRSRKPKTGAAS